MAAIPEGYCRIAYNYSPRGASGPRANVFCVKLVPDPGHPPIGSLDWTISAGEYMTGRWEDTLQGAFIPATELVSVQFSWDDGTAEWPAPPGLQGTAAGEPMPPEAAMILRMVAEGGGRRNRGRLFHPDVIESAVDSNGLVTNPNAALAWSDLFSSLDDIIDPTAGVFEQQLDGVHLLHSDGGAPSRVFAYGYNPRLGWLRRRGR